MRSEQSTKDAMFEVIRPHGDEKLIVPSGRNNHANTNVFFHFDIYGVTCLPLMKSCHQLIKHDSQI